MIALIQRVSEAQVLVRGESVGSIGRGLLALLGVRRGDTEADAVRLLERLLSYRVFPDAAGRMNLSLREVQGGLLHPQGHTCRVQHRSRAAGRTASVRASGGEGPGGVCPCFLRRIWRRHAGAPGERGARDLLAGDPMRGEREVRPGTGSNLWGCRGSIDL
jgi:hypothetical protein